MSALLKQICVLLSVCFAGQLLAVFIPLPASVLAMLLLFLMLWSGILKPGHIEKLGDWLMQNMAFFFLPACVMAFGYLDIIGKNLIAIAVISVVSTVITFAATAFTVRGLTKLTGRKGERRD